MIRHRQIKSAAHHVKDPNVLVIKTQHDPGPGMCYKHAVFELNASDPKGTLKPSIVQIDFIDGTVTDDPENGISANDYKKLEIKNLSAEICQSVGSFKGGIQYVTPTNYHKIVMNLSQK